jgi:hypothetical protein
LFLFIEEVVVKKLVLVSLFISLFTLGQAHACAKPDAPSLPNAETAVTPEMVKAKNEVTAYMKKAEDYLNCINKGNVSGHNRMVESMEKVAADFNALIKKFKARVKG